MRYRNKDPIPCRFEVSVTGLDYSEEEDEFLRAIVKYKQHYKISFLTAAEHFRILKQLGYRKGSVETTTQSLDENPSKSFLK